jgi:hypothetical protein
MAAGIAGIYKAGKIELLETPSGVPEGPVRVILIEDGTAKSALRYLQRGKYKGAGRLSTEEDFKAAEWRGEDLADAR